VLFVVLVGTEGSPGVDNLFQRVIDPSTESGGNRWQDVAVDLSPFAGQTIDFVFNTRSAAPAGAPAPRGAWGALQVVSRQLP
jgi:hypothetical protein